MIDVFKTQYHKPERGRLSKIGRCTDEGSTSTLLLVQEVDGSWTFHGLGAPGVTLSFHLDRTLLVGADGIPLADFLSEPAESWL